MHIKFSFVLSLLMIINISSVANQNETIFDVHYSNVEWNVHYLSKMSFYDGIYLMEKYYEFANGVADAILPHNRPQEIIKIYKNESILSNVKICFLTHKMLVLYSLVPLSIIVFLIYANMRTFCLYMRYNNYSKINWSPQNVNCLNSGDKYKKLIQFSWSYVSTISILILLIISQKNNEDIDQGVKAIPEIVNTSLFDLKLYVKTTIRQFEVLFLNNFEESMDYSLKNTEKMSWYICSNLENHINSLNFSTFINTMKENLNASKEVYSKLEILLQEIGEHEWEIAEEFDNLINMSQYSSCDDVKATLSSNSNTQDNSEESFESITLASDLENEENTFNYPIYSEDSTVMRIYGENEGINVYSRENTTEPYKIMTNLSERKHEEDELKSLKSFEYDTVDLTALETEKMWKNVTTDVYLQEITSDAYENESSVTESEIEKEESTSTTYFRDDSVDLTLTERLKNVTTDIYFQEITSETYGNKSAVKKSWFEEEESTSTTYFGDDSGDLLLIETAEDVANVTTDLYLKEITSESSGNGSAVTESGFEEKSSTSATYSRDDLGDLTLTETAEGLGNVITDNYFQEITSEVYENESVVTESGFEEKESKSTTYFRDDSGYLTVTETAEGLENVATDNYFQEITSGVYGNESALTESAFEEEESTSTTYFRDDSVDLRLTETEERLENMTTDDYFQEITSEANEYENAVTESRLEKEESTSITYSRDDSGDLRLTETAAGLENVTTDVYFQEITSEDYENSAVTESGFEEEESTSMTYFRDDSVDLTVTETAEAMENVTTDIYFQEITSKTYENESSVTESEFDEEAFTSTTYFRDDSRDLTMTETAEGLKNVITDVLFQEITSEAYENGSTVTESGFEEEESTSMTYFREPSGDLSLIEIAEGLENVTTNALFQEIASEAYKNKSDVTQFGFEEKESTPMTYFRKDSGDLTLTGTSEGLENVTTDVFLQEITSEAYQNESAVTESGLEEKESVSTTYFRDESLDFALTETAEGLVNVTTDVYFQEITSEAYENESAVTESGFEEEESISSTYVTDDSADLTLTKAAAGLENVTTDVYFQEITSKAYENRSAVTESEFEEKEFIATTYFRDDSGDLALTETAEGLEKVTIDVYFQENTSEAYENESAVTKSGFEEKESISTTYFRDDAGDLTLTETTEGLENVTTDDYYQEISSEAYENAGAITESAFEEEEFTSTTYCRDHSGDLTTTETAEGLENVTTDVYFQEITSEAYGNENAVTESGFGKTESISTTYFRDHSGDLTATETAEGLENVTTDIFFQEITSRTFRNESAVTESGFKEKESISTTNFRDDSGDLTLTDTEEGLENVTTDDYFQEITGEDYGNESAITESGFEEKESTSTTYFKDDSGDLTLIETTEGLENVTTDVYFQEITSEAYGNENAVTESAFEEEEFTSTTYFRDHSGDLTATETAEGLENVTTDIYFQEITSRTVRNESAVTEYGFEEKESISTTNFSDDSVDLTLTNTAEGLENVTTDDYFQEITSEDYGNESAITESGFEEKESTSTTYFRDDSGELTLIETTEGLENATTDVVFQEITSEAYGNESANFYSQEITSDIFENTTTYLGDETEDSTITGKKENWINVAINCHSQALESKAQKMRSTLIKSDYEENTFTSSRYSKDDTEDSALIETEESLVNVTTVANSQESNSVTDHIANNLSQSQYEQTAFLSLRYSKNDPENATLTELEENSVNVTAEVNSQENNSGDTTDHIASTLSQSKYEQVGFTSSRYSNDDTGNLTAIGLKEISDEATNIYFPEFTSEAYENVSATTKSKYERDTSTPSTVLESVHENTLSSAENSSINSSAVENNESRDEQKHISEHLQNTTVVIKLQQEKITLTLPRAMNVTYLKGTQEHSSRTATKINTTYSTLIPERSLSKYTTKMPETTTTKIEITKGPTRKKKGKFGGISRKRANFRVIFGKLKLKRNIGLSFFSLGRELKRVFEELENVEETIEKYTETLRNIKIILHPLVDKFKIISKGVVENVLQEIRKGGEFLQGFFNSIKYQEKYIRKEIHTLEEKVKDIQISLYNFESYRLYSCYMITVFHSLCIFLIFFSFSVTFLRIECRKYMFRGGLVLLQVSTLLAIIISLVHAVVGITAQTFLCRMNPKDNIIILALDEMKADEYGSVINTNFSTAILNCHKNMSLYEAFGLHKHMNLEEKKHKYFNVSNIERQFQPLLEVVLRFNDYISFDKSLKVVDVQNFIRFDNITSFNIFPEISAQLEILRKTPCSYKVTRKIHILEEKIVNFKAILANSFESYLHLPIKIENLISEVERQLKILEKDIENSIKSVTTDFENIITKQLKSFFDQRIIYSIKKTIGKCNHLSSALNSSANSICKKIIAPTNGLWFTWLINVSLSILILITFNKMENELFIQKKIRDE